MFKYLEFNTLFYDHPEAVARRCSFKKVVLKNLGKRLTQSLFFNKVAGCSDKDFYTGVFVFCKIFKKIFFTEHVQWLILVIQPLFSLESFTHSTHCECDYIIQICLVSFGSANQLAGFCMMGKLTFYELGETMPCVIKMRDM